MDATIIRLYVSRDDSVLDHIYYYTRGFVMAKLKYKLLPNEAIIARQDQILYGGFMAGFTSALILTSRNLVLMHKGTLGRVKKILVFPLEHIRVFNNQAQVFVTWLQFGHTELEIFMTHGSEKFGFKSKKQATNWMHIINQFLATGNVSVNTLSRTATSGNVQVAGASLGAKDILRKSFGIKTTPQPNISIEVVTTKCHFCGAPISGKKGELICCPYCNGDLLL